MSPVQLVSSKAKFLLCLLLLLPSLALAQVPRPYPGATTALTISGTSGNTLVVDTTTLVVDATNHRVGIGTASPSTSLTVLKNVTQLAAEDTMVTVSGTHTLSGANSQPYNGMGITTNANQAGSSYTGGTRGLQVFPKIIGATGTAATGLGINVQVSNTGGGTLTNGYGFYSSTPLNSGGGTFANFTGFLQEASTVGSAALLGFRGQLAAAATRWNLYMDGTAQNFLAGNVGIGSGKSVPGVALDVNGVASLTGVQIAGVLLCNSTAPTISSGFGTSPSIAASNGSCAFTINVGTGGVATSGVIGLPTATTGWVVRCNDNTTTSATVYLTKQTATSTTTATIGNFAAAGTAAAWTASDILACSANAY